MNLKSKFDLDHEHRCIHEIPTIPDELRENKFTFLCKLTQRTDSKTLTEPMDECSFRKDKTECKLFEE